MTSGSLPPVPASLVGLSPWGSALTPERLERFERGLPHPLPADFRKFLTWQNGVLLGKCATGMTDALGREVLIGDIFGVHEDPEYGLAPGDPNVPPDVLVFTSQRGSINRIGLQLADRPDSPAGTVWFFDSDAESETDDLFVASACAPSFSAFLARLSPLPAELPPVVVPPPEPPDSPWSNPEARAKVPADVPTPEKPLVLAGHGYAVQSARLEVHVDTWVPDLEASAYRYQPDRPEVTYSLELEAALSEGDPGDDGVPAPVAQDIPVARANGGRHPTLAEWSTLVVGPECGWDAWYGNDAPALENNRLTVLGRSGENLTLRWEASYSEYGHDYAFLFEGPVRFAGIHFDVETPSDIERVLASAFGSGHRPEEWTREVGPPRDIWEKRRVLPVTLVPAVPSGT